MTKSDEQRCIESIGTTYTHMSKDNYGNKIRVETMAIKIEDGMLCYNWRYPNDGVWSDTWYGMKTPCAWYAMTLDESDIVSKSTS